MLFRDLSEGFLAELGVPATIARMVRSMSPSAGLPEFPRSLSCDSLLKWQDWPASKLTICSQGSAGLISLLYGSREQFQLTRKSEYPSWKCDIRQVDGLCMPHSRLQGMSTFAELALDRCSDLIGDVSVGSLLRSLAGRNRYAAGGSGRSDSFVRHGWDGRMFLAHQNDARHFAATRYLAEQLRRPVRLEGRLVIHRLDTAAVRNLTDDFMMFALRIEDAHAGFMGAMETFGAPFGIRDMPQPYCRTMKALLLPRDELRSIKVAAILQRNKFLNLGVYLEEQARKVENQLTIPPPLLRIVSDGMPAYQDDGEWDQ